MPRLKSLIGKKFGRLEVISRSETNIGNKPAWQCQCSCGKQAIVSGYRLVGGNTQSCGCLQHESAVNLFDLTGQRFGSLVVIRQAGHNCRGAAIWLCHCDCGNTKTIVSNNLREGRLGRYKTSSCGCNQYHLRIPPSKYVWFNYRGSAKRRNLPFSLTLERLTEIISQPCDYCGKPPSQAMSPSQTRKRKHPIYHDFRWNGIDRIDSAQGYVEGNVVPCCKACNELKSDKSREEFLRLVEAIYRHRIANIC